MCWNVGTVVNTHDKTEKNSLILSYLTDMDDEIVLTTDQWINSESTNNYDQWLYKNTVV